jgi:O-antigen ligase
VTRSLPPQEEPPESEPTGSLRPTDLRSVAVAALCGAVVGWFVLSIFVVTDAMVPILPWSLPIILAVVAGGVWIDSRVLRRKVADPHREVSPTEGLVSLALGKALVLTGAALAGACVVYVVTFIRQWSIPYPRQRVITGTASAVVCALLAVAGWALERACRVPPDGGSDRDDRLGGRGGDDSGRPVR